MAPFMEHLAFCCPLILLPLSLQMDQCPLPSAKGKMLDAGKLEILLFHRFYPFRIQVTPAGNASSATDTS